MPSLPVLCTYWPKPGREAELQRLLERHGPSLDRIGLKVPGRAVVWRVVDKDGAVRFVERFDWVDEKAPGLAHQHPEVMAMWEPIGALCERMDFSTAEVVAGSE